jgi:hypothetical protein
MGSGCIDPRILETSALVGDEWSASRPGRFVPRGKSLRYPLDKRLGGYQNRSGRRGEKKNLALTGGPLGRPARGQSLYRLSYPGFFSWQGEEILSSPLLSDRLWGPPSLLFNGYMGLFPQGGLNVPGRESDHSHLVPRI